MPKGKILIIRGGAIGDFILTLPAIAAVRQQFPEAHLELLGYPHIAQLALAGGLVDRVQSIDARALAGFFARNGTLAEDLVDYFSEFDMLISYLYDPDEIFRTNISQCTRGQYIAGPHRAREADGEHAAKVYLKPLERIAIFDAPSVPSLPLSAVARDEGRPLTIALHPGSGSEKKNWPEEGWSQFIQQLITTTDANLFLVGGEAEGERLQRLAAALPPLRVRIAQSLPLHELAAELEQCDFFIGHDSGISHLASAVGLPGLLLWGDTAKEVWRPPSEKIVVLQPSGGLAKLGVNTVVEAFTNLFTSTVKT